MVKNVTKTDGLGHSYTTSYDYSGGVFETESREFRGFGYVRVTDPEGHYKETCFHQDDVYKGRPEKEEVHDKYGRIYQEVNYTWQEFSLDQSLRVTEGDESTLKDTFPALGDKETIIYNPNDEADFKSTRVQYDYDGLGNPLEVKEYGFEGELLKTTNITYYEDRTKWIVSKPLTSITSGNPEVKTEYEYDDNCSLRTEKKWLNDGDRWIATSFGYDDYGNVTSVTDALGRTTATTYESTNTFPAEVKNELDHTQNFTYDYATGKILTSTDPNSQTTTSTYDGFGRLRNLTGPGSISEVSYDYQDATINADGNIVTPFKITTTTKVSDTEDITSYSWADGLGRIIEAIQEAESDEGDHIISGIVKYDSRGQVIEKYLPEFVVGAGFSPSSYEGKHVTYIYDPLGRVTQTIRPDNKVSQNIYSITTIETINENGQRKRITKDVYGRITQVEEFNEGQTYTTDYEYDTLGNLTDTYDSAAPRNHTHIEYDSLGRKISMDDPDMGHWEYEYDEVGNLRYQTDAKDVRIEFQYDEINRLRYKITPDYTIEYQYDDTSKPNRKGRLSKVIDQSGITEFEYDELGRETKTTKTIDGIPYTIERTYDSLDRLKTVTYPILVAGDTPTVVTYTYNKQGGIETVDMTGPGGTVPCVTSTTYNANGQLEEIVYGNGRTTTYEYDPDNLRLKQLETPGLQNLFYTFDPIGNVTQIHDDVNSNSQSFTYDDLNRLTSATGNAYGTIAYEYDPIGNMTRKGDMTLIYGQGAGPHAVTSISGSESYSITYDDNGNMLTKGATTQYTYDPENRLTEVVTPKGGEAINVNISLSSGWNFISFPFRNIEIERDERKIIIPIEDATIQEVLQSINDSYDQVSRYDETLNDPNTGKWQHFVKNEDFNQFSNLEYGEGYVLHATQACSLTLKGTSPISEQQITLETGWNLIFSPSATSISIEDAFTDITYYSIYGDNGVSYYTPTELETGKSYWVYVPTTQIWNIESEQATTQYTYDGDGGRVTKTVDDRTTIYIGSSYEITIDNTTGDVIKSKRHIFMGSNRICEVEQIGEDIEAYFVHADHIGSSNVITKSDGSRASLFEYKPFGSVAYADTTDYNTDKRFTGKTYDSSSGLYYYGARYYDSELGRFISPDPTIQHPYDPQDFNRYAYCRNNPVKYVDPTGYGFFDWLWSFFKGFVAAVGTVLLTPVLGNPVAAAAVSGAITGAVFGAIEGGLEGALHGAAWGFAIGGIAGTAGAIDPSGSLLALAFVGGATYSGIVGGGEGLANFAAGSAGAATGHFTGKTIVGKSTVKTIRPEAKANNKPGTAAETKVDQNLSNGDVQGSNDVRSRRSGTPPAEQIAHNQAKIAQAGQEGTIGTGNNTSRLQQFRQSQGGVNTHAFLNNLATLSKYASLGCAFGGLAPGFFVFGAISALCTALDIMIFSDKPIKDTFVEGIKLIAGEKAGNAGSMFTDWALDEVYKNYGAPAPSY